MSVTSWPWGKSICFRPQLHMHVHERGRWCEVKDTFCLIIFLLPKHLPCGRSPEITGRISLGAAQLPPCVMFCEAVYRLNSAKVGVVANTTITSIKQQCNSDA